MENSRNDFSSNPVRRHVHKVQRSGRQVWGQIDWLLSETYLVKSPLGCTWKWQGPKTYTVPRYLSYSGWLCPVTVTTRIITFLVGNPYKPSFATVTGWGVDPISIRLPKWFATQISSPDSSPEFLKSNEFNSNVFFDFHGLIVNPCKKYLHLP